MLTLNYGQFFVMCNLKVPVCHVPWKPCGLCAICNLCMCRDNFWMGPCGGALGRTVFLWVAGALGIAER